MIASDLSPNIQIYLPLLIFFFINDIEYIFWKLDMFSIDYFLCTFGHAIDFAWTMRTDDKSHHIDVGPSENTHSGFL